MLWLGLVDPLPCSAALGGSQRHTEPSPNLFLQATGQGPRQQGPSFISLQGLPQQPPGHPVPEVIWKSGLLLCFLTVPSLRG